MRDVLRMILLTNGVWLMALAATASGFDRNSGHLAGGVLLTIYVLIHEEKPRA